VRIRAARIGEAAAISALALRSKGHWGYPPEFLEACRAELTIRDDELSAARAHVAEDAGALLGFFTVTGTPPEGELDCLYVDPAAVGRGVGRRLLDAARSLAAGEGFRALTIHSDPNAEGFYLRHGATRIGEAPSRSIAGRMLPVLRLVTKEPARLVARPWTLLRQAAGSPKQMAGKAARLGRVLARYGRWRAIERRLEGLRARGVIDVAPTRVQLAVGAWDMLRFFISPAAAEYYASKGIGFGFHQVLRFLEEPASLADPVGLLSTRDGIIGHLMQVVHANPVYDLELLGMFDDGWDELERQIEAMLAGTHPRAASIGAIVEEPEYHERLLAYVRGWRKDPAAPPLLRTNIVASERFARANRTFGSLRTAMRYFARLPRDPLVAARHALTVKELRDALAEPPESESAPAHAMPSTARRAP
jgi:GNAT superfamily N-acetyltransferase